MARKLLQHFPSLSIHQSDRRVQRRHCHRFAVFQQVDRRDGVFKIIFHQLSHPDIVRANIAVNGSSNELVPGYDNASDRVFCILEDLDGMALLRFDVPNAHGGVEASTNQQIAIKVECACVDHSGVSTEPSQDCTGRYVPIEYRAIPSDASEERIIW